MIPWLSDYVGLPYKEGSNGPDSFDCWGFVRHVALRQFGFELPALSYGADEQERSSLIIEHKPAFQQLAGPEHGAIVLFHTPNRRTHVGLCIEGTDVLHMMINQGAILTPLTALWLKNGIYGYFVPNTR